MNKFIKIAIDGPAGAGKSTIAKFIAKELGITYLDTGAMYRAMAFKYLNTDLDINDKTEMKEFLQETDLQIILDRDQQKIILDGVDITDAIRTPQVSDSASRIATSPEVRKRLVEIQRAIADERSVVMDGRDIGTHVLPDADIKIFLTASLEERASRRYDEYRSRGEHKPLESVLTEIEGRDHNDSTREFAPLKMAEDAILVDTTGKSVQDVIDMIINIVDKNSLGVGRSRDVL